MPSTPGQLSMVRCCQGRDRRAWGWVLLGALATVCCDRHPADPGVTGEGPGPVSLTSDARSGEDLAEAERLAQLAQLGYAEASSVRAGSEHGVVVHERKLAWPGYNLSTVVPRSLSVLMDNDGRVINSWKVEDSFWMSRCELLDNGDVLVVGSRYEGAESSGYLLRMTWDGEVLWRREVNAHHDVELTPAGRILTLTWENRWLRDLDSDKPCQDNGLSLFDGDGNLLESLSLHDLVASQPERLRLVRSRKGVARSFTDFFHANSVGWMPENELLGTSPLYAADNVLVSLRHQDTLVVINWSTRELVWSWGRGELLLPHEASWLPNGDVLVFDNGDNTRRWSRIVEVDPRSDEIVWQYRAAHPEDFYSPGRGTAQLLPNDNVLVAHSAAGEAFEITRSGRIVWRFLSPELNQGGSRLAIRIKRYSTDMVERVLRSHDGSDH